MLIIRRAQIPVLAQALLGRFEEELAEHIRGDWPADAAALGPDGLKATVHAGVARALGHGFETEQDLSRYVYLMFTFGAGFDRDPELPWAAQALASSGGAAARMQRLYDSAQDHEHLGRGITASS